MSTVEDVFCLYERNHLDYLNCSKNGKLDSCPTKWMNECYCHMDSDTMPLTIGDQSVPCILNRKCYIKPGEECPICFEPILTKNNAYITRCGHSFHRSCLFKTYETKHNNKPFAVFRCPMCRSMTEKFMFYTKYNIKRDMSTLDYLENFWLSKDYDIPMYCSNKYNHYLGMKPNCKKCKLFCKNGN